MAYVPVFVNGQWILTKAARVRRVASNRRQRSRIAPERSTPPVTVTYDKPTAKRSIIDRAFATMRRLFGRGARNV